MSFNTGSLRSKRGPWPVHQSAFSPYVTLTNQRWRMLPRDDSGRFDLVRERYLTSRSLSYPILIRVSACFAWISLPCFVVYPAPALSFVFQIMTTLSTATRILEYCVTSSVNTSKFQVVQVKCTLLYTRVNDISSFSGFLSVLPALCLLISLTDKHTQYTS